MTRKTYPTAVALSAASGRLLCDFADLHKAITDLAGWPVMTHHMGSQTLMDRIAAKILRQVPWMPGAIENIPDWSHLDRDQARAAIAAWLDRVTAAHGPTVTLALGEPLPPLGLLDGLGKLGAAR